MKKLLIGAALCALFAAPTLAAEPAKVATEPVKLSLTQMDGLTAGFCFIAICSQINATSQTATAVAVATGGSLVGFGSGNAAAGATAFNVNGTVQSQ
jgi:hypothetical protein